MQLDCRSCDFGPRVRATQHFEKEPHRGTTSRPSGFGVDVFAVRLRYPEGTVVPSGGLEQELWRRTLKMQIFENTPEDAKLRSSPTKLRSEGVIGAN